MANEPKYIEPGETRLIVQNDDTAEYWATVLGTEVQLGRTEASARQRGRRAPAGDRGPLRAEAGEEVYVYNPEDGGGTAEMYLDHNGFFWDRQPRSVIGGVQTSSDNEAAPSSDEFRHFNATGVDVTADPVSHSFNAPDRADFVVIHVDDADGAYTVHVEYTDPDGNVQTSVTGNDNSDLSGDSATDVLTRVAIASPDGRVRITDDSGAANTLDYNIYAR